MEIIKIKGNKDFLKEIEAPSSKSFSHRYILGAFFCGKKVRVNNIIYSKDTLATLGAIEKIGALVEKGKDYADIFFDKKTMLNEDIEIDCIESASTLRFIIPICAALGIKCKIYGKESLMKRPINVYTKIFDEEGFDYEYKKGEYIKLDGKLCGGKYKIDGSISSQFITGLMFALSILDKESEIIIENNLESKPYVDITLSVLDFYGVKILNNDYKSFKIIKNQKYIPKDAYVEGDYSQGCAFIGAAAIFGKLKITNLLKNSPQGDKKFIDYIKMLGANVKVYDDYVECEKAHLTSDKTFDLSDCPDIAPVFSAVCAFAKGKTTLTGIERLRIKESDRAKAIVKTLLDFGVRAEEMEDRIIIFGCKNTKGGTFDTFNDHRIAMMISILSLGTDDDVYIKTPMCVEKSYPKFYDDFDGIITVIK